MYKNQLVPLWRGEEHLVVCFEPNKTEDGGR